MRDNVLDGSIKMRDPNLKRELRQETLKKYINL